jgi:hypothetical protein
MKMRALAFALPFLVIGAAQADEPRLAPQVGAKLTYRLIAKTTNNSGRTSASGQVYTYTITSSDGAVAEATIKLDAMLYPCRNRADDPFCARVLNAPGAEADGEMVRVPLPEALSESLGKDSAFRVRYLIVERRVAALPALNVGGGANDPLFNPADPMTTTNAMDCESDALKDLPPIGDAQHVALSCRASVSRSGGTTAAGAPATSTEPVTLDIFDFGLGEIQLPSGTWSVRRLKVDIVPKSGAQTIEGETRFSEKLGVAVKTHWTATSGNNDSIIDLDSELIDAKP